MTPDKSLERTREEIKCQAYTAAAAPLSSIVRRRRRRVSTDSLPRARSSVEVLGSPQGGRERVVACVVLDRHAVHGRTAD